MGEKVSNPWTEGKKRVCKLKWDCFNFIRIEESEKK